MTNNKYFLGAVSDTGFVSLFDELRQPEVSNRLYILKGGPGSGKSTLIKRCAAELTEAGHEVELFCCASDLDSLDAMIDHDAGIAIADGTAPHIVEPRFPGAYETIVDTGQAWDAGLLAQRRGEIKVMTEENKRWHENCGALLRAAGAIIRNNMALGAELAKECELEYCALEIAGMFDPEKENGTKGERRRLLSAVTAGKVAYLSETVNAGYDKIYTINDPLGGAANILINKVRIKALKAGIRVITCPCSVVNPYKTDHLLFPNQRICITAHNDFFGVYPDKTVVLDGYDMMCRTRLEAEFAVRMEQKQLADIIVQQAAEASDEAKRVHDELETFYIDALDHTRLDRIFCELIDEIEFRYCV